MIYISCYICMYITIHTCMPLIIKAFIGIIWKLGTPKSLFLINTILEVSTPFSDGGFQPQLKAAKRLQVLCGQKWQRQQPQFPGVWAGSGNQQQNEESERHGCVWKHMEYIVYCTSIQYNQLKSIKRWCDHMWPTKHGISSLRQQHSTNNNSL